MICAFYNNPTFLAEVEDILKGGTLQLIPRHGLETSIVNSAEEYLADAPVEWDHIKMQVSFEAFKQSVLTKTPVRTEIKLFDKTRSLIDFETDVNLDMIVAVSSS